MQLGDQLQVWFDLGAQRVSLFRCPFCYLHSCVLCGSGGGYVWHSSSCIRVLYYKKGKQKLMAKGEVPAELIWKRGESCVRWQWVGLWVWAQRSATEISEGHLRAAFMTHSWHEFTSPRLHHILKHLPCILQKALGHCLPGPRVVEGRVLWWMWTHQ